VPASLHSGARSLSHDDLALRAAKAARGLSELDARLDADHVRAHARDRLPGYQVPKIVEFREELPREDTGKIFKRLLREPYWEGRERRI
jgi:long-chain acyl-CoA synthetase